MCCALVDRTREPVKYWAAFLLLTGFKLANSHGSVSDLQHVVSARGCLSQPDNPRLNPGATGHRNNPHLLWNDATSTREPVFNFPSQDFYHPTPSIAVL